MKFFFFGWLWKRVYRNGIVFERRGNREDEEENGTVARRLRLLFHRLYFLHQKPGFHSFLLFIIYYFYEITFWKFILTFFFFFQQQLTDNYFYESADKISFFFEGMVDELFCLNFYFSSKNIYLIAFLAQQMFPRFGS